MKLFPLKDKISSSYRKIFHLQFWKNHDGATAIEYSLIAAGIALAIITIVFLMGDEVLAMFQDVQTSLATNL